MCRRDVFEWGKSPLFVTLSYPVYDPHAKQRACPWWPCCQARWTGPRREHKRPVVPQMLCARHSGRRGNHPFTVRLINLWSCRLCVTDPDFPLSLSLSLSTLLYLSLYLALYLSPSLSVCLPLFPSPEQMHSPRRQRRMDDFRWNLGITFGAIGILSCTFPTISYQFANAVMRTSRCGE